MYSSKIIKNLLYLMSLLFFIGAWAYIIVSIEMIFRKYPITTFSYLNYLGIFFNLLVLVFELITALYGIFLLIHTALVFNKPDNFTDYRNLKTFPLVSLIIPTYNPNIYAIETNLLHLSKLTYSNKEIFITDNSDDPSIINQLQILTEKFHVNFIHREGLQGFKARNLNDVLEKIKGKYFIIIDIDQSLKNHAIEKFLSTFENAKDENLAFVQGRFDIKNANNIVRTSIAILYTFFYDLISLAKTYRKSVLFNGSSACFNTQIVKAIGGFPENCYTEDIAISNVLLLNGYHSLYLNESVTTALVPWKLTTLLSSFWRWTHGGTSCLNLYGAKIIKSKKISLDKKIELITNIFSFIAISGILIILYSILCMYWLKIDIIRPNFLLNLPKPIGLLVIPLFAFFPLFTSLNHLINCVIGMWESKTLHRILYLIPYSVETIAISFFIIFPTYYALLNIKGPDSPQSLWNRKFSVSKVIILLLINSAIFLYSGYDALIHNNPLWISFASLVFVSLSTIAFLIKDLNIDVSKEEYNYFHNFRVQMGLNE